VAYLVGDKQRDLTGRTPGDPVKWKDAAGVEHVCRVMIVMSNEPGEPMLRLSLPCREWVRWDSVEPMGRTR
jgi:hypothetical protein